MCRLGFSVLRRVLLGGVLALSLLSCQRERLFPEDVASPRTPRKGDGVSRSAREADILLPRRAVLVLGAAYNNLAGYIADDLYDLEHSGYLSTHDWKDSCYIHAYDPVVLECTRFPVSYGNYSVPTQTTLCHVYADGRGHVLRDTLKVWPADVLLSDSTTVREALECAWEAFPDLEYGILFSSHSSGWTPPGYYDEPRKFEGTSWLRAGAEGGEEYPPLPASPLVRSVGSDFPASEHHEMSLGEFVGALDGIPGKLEFLLFDSCLMGGVEVAYALRDKVKRLIFSSAEVLGEGFEYNSVARNLIGGKGDEVEVARDYFNHFDAQHGDNRSATVSVVETEKMDDLVRVCADLCRDYHDALYGVDYNLVQRYFRFNRHFFYDLQDIFVQAGISTEDQGRLQRALDACVLYKAATPSFIPSDNGFDIKTFCGLSMFLPAHGGAWIKNYYRDNIAWNDAVQLIQPEDL